MHNHDMIQPDSQLGIITIQGFIWINSMNYFSKGHPLSVFSVSTPMATGSAILIIRVKSDSDILSGLFDIPLEYPMSTNV